VKPKAKEAEDVKEISTKKTHDLNDKALKSSKNYSTEAEPKLLSKKALTKKEFTPKKVEPKVDKKEEPVKKEEAKKNLAKKVVEDKKVPEKKSNSKPLLKTVDKTKRI
jgi:hypothetical protein